MKEWLKTLVAPETTIREALAVIGEGNQQVALVVDGERRLLGVVTDGDIRRAILDDIPLDSPVSRIMFTDFTAVGQGESREEILSLMRSRELRHIPVLDEAGRIVDLKVLLHMVAPSRDNWVVLMAGGLGSRLRPLTDDCPKPLLHVGGRPVLETILRGFIEYGFHRFYLSVNYKSEMIEDHFGDGSRFGADIRYLREPRRMGTAGCLGLLPERPEQPFFVMNGDLLTRINFEEMLAFHEAQGAWATMGIREYATTVPYGVVEVDGHRILQMVEKPVHKHFVNAGVYALSPRCLDHVGQGEFLDMPVLFQRLMEEGGETAAFPIHEYWLDIGRHDDFEQAHDDYLGHFGPDDGA